MKKFRILSSFLVLIALMAVILRIPYVQKYIFRFYLKRHFNEIYLDKVSIGLSSAKLQKMCLVNDNAEFKVTDLRLKWSLRDLILFRELKLRDIFADGVFISYDKAEKKEKKASKPLTKQQIPFLNIKENIKEKLSKLSCAANFNFMALPKLPFRVTIDHLKINGFLNIGESFLVDAALEGSNFAPLSTALLDIKADVEIEGLASNTLRLYGHSKICQSKEAFIDGVEFNGKCELLDIEGQHKKTFNIVSSCGVDPTENSYCLCVDNDTDKENVCYVEVRFKKDRRMLTINCEQNCDMAIFDVPSVPSVTLKSRWNVGDKFH
jgi:hypothetical protein